MAIASSEEFTPRVSVYSSVAENGSAVCSNITCVGEGTTFYSFTSGSRAFFQTEMGVQYFIRVGGDYSHISGRYELAVDTAICPENDSCYNANTFTSLPALIRGNIANATGEGSLFSKFDPETGYRDKCYVAPSTPTIWYETNGTGGCLLFSVAGAYNTYVAIFENNFKTNNTAAPTVECDSNNMKCMAESRSSTYQSPFITWLSQINTTYKIAISGSAVDESGDLLTTLTSVSRSQCDDEPVMNDECDDATLITTFPFNDTIKTNSASGERFFPGTCWDVNPSLRGVWYKIIGNGTCYSVSAQNVADISYYRPPPVLAILHGPTSSCFNLTCTSATDNYVETGVTMGLSTKQGEVYYILVGSRYGETGTYSIAIEPIDCLANGLCKSSTRATVPFIETGGSTLLAINGKEENQNSSSSSTLSSELISTCGVDENMKAVWYSTIGTGGCLIASISETSVDAGIAIYEDHGAMCCKNITCFMPYFSGWGGSTVAFPSEVNMTYQFAVAGSYGTTLTDFIFLLDDTPTCPVIPTNTQCTSASIVNTTQLPYDDTTNTWFSKPASLNSYGYYGNCFSDRSRAIWYQLVGTGSCFSISAFSSTLDIQVAVFEGSASCNAMTCVGSTQMSSGSPYILSTESGTVYMIRVGGQYGTAGAFTIVFDEVTCPTNIICSSAETLEATNVVVTGTTEFATQIGYNGGSDQCGFDGYMQAVWYQYQGHGGCVTASAIGSGYVTAMAVYESDNGSCDELRCLDHTHISTDSGSITWQAENQTSYKILVGGTSPGNFIFSLLDDDQCADIPSNPTCDSAIELSLDDIPLSMEIDNQLAYADLTQISSCYDIDGSKSLWYSLVGDGNCYKATSTRLSDNVDPVIGIFVGQDCESRVCVQQSEGYYGASIGFRTVVGEIYYVAVAGRYGSSGKMMITIEQTQCAENGACGSSMLVENIPFIDVTTDVVEQLGHSNGNQLLQDCLGIYQSTQLLWYTINGTGSCLAAASNADNIHPVIAVMEGDGCDNALQCVDQSALQYGGGGYVFWQTQANVTYKLLIATQLSVATGSDVTVFVAESDECSIASAANAECEASKLIDDFPFHATVFPEGSTSSNVYPGSSCYMAEYIAKSAWYQIVGDGRCYNVQAQSMTGPVVVAVFESETDECESMICLQQRQVEMYERQSGTSFQTVVNQTYYVLIGSNNGAYYGSRIDSVQVTISTSECAENDSCVNAALLNGTFPMLMQGDTSIATSEATSVQVTLDSCGFQESSYAVWYELVGHGACVEARVISSNYMSQLSLSVFEGGDSDCDGIQCFVPLSASNFVSWMGVNDTVYHIAVANMYGSSAGPFTLLITEEPDCPDVPINDSCETASFVNITDLPYRDSGSLALTNDLSNYLSGSYGYYGYNNNNNNNNNYNPGESYSSSSNTYGSSLGNGTTATTTTTTTSQILERNDCWTFNKDSQVVWYTITGDGTCVNVQLKYTSTSGYSTPAIVVFEKLLDCDYISCLMESAGYGYGPNQNVIVKTDPGVEYMIAVASSYDLGTYEITIDESTCTHNDQCSSALNTNASNYITSSSTKYATFSSTPNNPAQACYNTIEYKSKQLWYAGVGDGTCWSASVASDFSNPIIAVVAASGTDEEDNDDECATSRCVARLANGYYFGYGGGGYYHGGVGGNGGIVTWQTAVNVTYRIAVGSSSMSYDGDFVFTLSVRLCAMSN
jgi:hypothetical protein